MKRYFIYSMATFGRNSSSWGKNYVITNGEYPSLNSIMLYHRMASNVQHQVSITEVKSVKDIEDFFGYNKVEDEVNYPFPQREEREEDDFYLGNGD